MNKNKLILLSFSVMIGLIVISTTAYNNNIGKAAKVGSPGELMCNECHNTNALNAGGGNITISSPNLINWVYTPGVTYTINVKVEKTSGTKFGFGFEALLASGANAGIINTTSSANAKTASASVSGNLRTSAVHKSPSHFGTDSLVFSFEWTAPAAGSGGVTFYSAGNAANANNSSTGDFIYNTSQIVSEGPTGVVENSKALNLLSVYPNPAIDQLLLNLPSGSNNTFKIVIYSIDGAKQLEINQSEGTTFNNTLLVNINQLSQGVYVIQLVDNRTKYQAKFIKQ